MDATSYLLAVAALLLLAGALADRFGRRRVLVIGLCVMGVASVLCASASSIESLIAARAVQGIGAALVVPTSLALLNGTLRVDDRARGIRVLIGVSAGSSLAAALATGYEPAMLVIGGLCVGGALVAWLFVSDKPGVAPRLAAPDRGCAPPVLDPKEAR